MLGGAAVIASTEISTVTFTIQQPSQIVIHLSHALCDTNVIKKQLGMMKCDRRCRVVALSSTQILQTWDETGGVDGCGEMKPAEGGEKLTRGRVGADYSHKYIHHFIPTPNITSTASSATPQSH